ncbi:hypothetical protein [Ramlibacter sp. AN1133]|uniref:hypothetical protein n=1 Tax=Ramlibacter sp. AN1133 TaxID=3133429 RepID=UPI0030C20734
MTEGRRLVRVEGVWITPGVAYQLRPNAAGHVDYQERDLPPHDHAAQAVHYIGYVRPRDGRAVTFPLRWMQGAAELTMRVRFDAPAAGRFKDLCLDHDCVFQVARDLSGMHLEFRDRITDRPVGKIWLPGISVTGNVHPAGGHHPAEPVIARERPRERFIA